jgi:hypothetical protein
MNDRGDRDFKKPLNSLHSLTSRVTKKQPVKKGVPSEVLGIKKDTRE